MPKIKMNLYLHSDKESNMETLREECEDLDIEDLLTEEALGEFSYALYEVCFHLEVDTETGKYKVLGVEF